MRRPPLVLLLTTTLVAAIACEPSSPTSTPAADTPSTSASASASASASVDYQAQADALAHRFVILDGHVDVPIRVAGAVREGLAVPPVHDHADDGDFDYARARAGGLDAPFMSIYTPSAFEAEPGKSKAFADQNIDFVVGLATDHPDKFALAVTPAQVRSNFERGLISLAMGMENGAPIEGELANLRHFHERGIRYITLTHAKDNHICDSSYDQAHTHAGLSPFGREVVVEMNRLGIMIDVSHVSDDSFWQIMELSAAPAIASHSSCRKFTPGFERNMSDEMIVALAEHGGVIQINFGSGFLDAAYRDAEQASEAELAALLEAHQTDRTAPEGERLIEAYRAAHPLPRVDVGVVADHIDHVVSLAGVDHVGLGSDFDGVGDTLPDRLKDVSMYPNLLAELLRRGYTEAEIEKICSGNVLRVWQAVEDHAARF
ncbi:dipeptidase [Enhygromyxa salina]|uniref:Membrane dipeptidase n=1 Tax=Enhygromyxa salina TaxID=215803 RepID=A0A2S9YPW5_9BACT|nr:dipeptidase [Enhygromyxa salina]PRQ07133.1 Membrane dipeptidase [Enhygromyxa salina]